MNKLNWKALGVCALTCQAMVAELSAQTFTTLTSFDNYNGAKPGNIRLVQGLDGNYYGTTEGGADFTGGWGHGTIFQVTPDGTLTTLHRFGLDDPNGSAPASGLMQVMSGDFYGSTTQGGGSGSGMSGFGTIFRITAGGSLTRLHVFESLDGGGVPSGFLVPGVDGNFYGTTARGGPVNCGTIFRMTPDGTLTTLYNFSGLDGQQPAGLVLGIDGSIYGTTSFSGNGPNGGTVFKMSLDGRVATIFKFDRHSGFLPTAGLTLGADGSFYGTTYIGGPQGYGTVFRITPDGRLKVLHAFDQDTGAFPSGGLVSASDGNLYGVTLQGGGSSYGNIFRVTPGGDFTSLFTFSSPIQQGSQPRGALLQGTDGNFYGTTWFGGSTNMGVLYRFSAGLPPFVKALPHIGKAGDAIAILGSNLAGATSVRFNGTPAVFKVVSPSLISATIPAGARTGYITAATPGGTLKSAGPFFVQ